MGRLVSFVHVFDDNDEAHTFGPDDDVPEWAARKMGAHCFEDGDHPFGDDESSDGRDAGSPPPKAGAGSSIEAWSAYASEQGVEVPEGAKRDEIIAALESAGKPVE